MNQDVDLDDVVRGNARAERQLKNLRDELALAQLQCITCGVAATHPNPTLTLRDDYMKWDSQQAEEVRKLRADRDRLQSENFSLAAAVCPMGFGDEGGTPRCCAEREIERLTAALVKVIAHTGHTKPGPDQLHIDLLARIEHIAQSALQGRAK